MLINGRYKKVGKLGDGSYGDVFKCIDYFPTAESRLLPQSTVDLIRSVEKGDVLTDSDDFEDNFTDLFSENDKFMNSSEENKVEAPEEGKEHYVAIKKSKMRRMDYLKHSFNFSTYREIAHIQELDHENIIKIVDVFYKDKSIYTVLEFMEGDLYQLIHKEKAVLDPAHIKCIMHQVLVGLKFLHENKIMHRDLKPGNLLISKEGIIKYSDFGLARYCDIEDLKTKETEAGKLTRNVSTRYYRAPEILYGIYNYDFSIDIWSAGCIMGELALGDFLFKGENEIDQLSKIFCILGNAVESCWPGVTELPNYIEFECKQDKTLESMFSSHGDQFVDLISKMVVLDPSKRLTVDEALSHPYFSCAPFPCHPSELPKPSLPAEKIDSFTDSD